VAGPQQRFAAYATCCPKVSATEIESRHQWDGVTGSMSKGGVGSSPTPKGEIMEDEKQTPLFLAEGIADLEGKDLQCKVVDADGVPVPMVVETVLVVFSEGQQATGE